MLKIEVTDTSNSTRSRKAAHPIICARQLPRDDPTTVTSTRALGPLP